MPGRDGPGATGMATRSGGWLSGLAMLGGLMMVRTAWRWLRDGHDGRPPPVRQQAVHAGHETRDAPVLWPVVGIVLVFLGIGAAVLVATWFQARWVDRPLTLSPPPGLATPGLPPPPPEPRLEAVPGAQFQAYRAAAERVLHDTSWVDRPAGIARIPIDRAIDLLVENPPPARPVPDAGRAASTAAGPPSDASSGRVPTGRVP